MGAISIFLACLQGYMLMQAKTAKDGRKYLSYDGKAHYFPKGLYERLSTFQVDTPSDTDTDNGAIQTPPEHGGENVRTNNIYHFLYMRKITVGEEVVTVIQRVVSNAIADRFREEYDQSVASSGKVCGVIQALPSTNYGFPFLEKILAGRNWTLVSVPVAALAKVPEMQVDYLKRSCFAFSTASQAYYLKVEDASEWGLEQFGVGTRHAKKLVKRLAEVVRYTKTGLWTDDFAILKVNNTRMPVEFTDGKGYISRTMAARIFNTIEDLTDAAFNVRDCLTGAKKEIILRGVTGAGVLKGNFIIMPDSWMVRNGIQYDFIVDAEAIKKELFLDGNLRDTGFFTAWDYGNLHVAVWDGQSLNNFPQVLTAAMQQRDLQMLVSNIVKSINEGNIPEFLMLGEEAHNEDGVPSMEQLSDQLHLSHIRWQAYGLDIRAAQNLLYMAMNGVIKRMKGGDNNLQAGYYKKMWLPMMNAGAFSVVTYESLTRLGGAKFKQQDGSVCFYDERFGFVMPGDRFLETFALHDGWDLDDVLRALKVKVFCSDHDKLSVMREHGAVPKGMVVPEQEADAIQRLFTWRTPNAPGGWAIEEFDFSTWPKELKELDTDDMLVVDLATLPLPLTALTQKVKVGTLPTSTVYTKASFTREQAGEMITTQTFNPGVGRFVNPLIAWANATNGRSYPPEMPCILNDAVDSMQQGYDLAEFAAIESGIEQMTAQIIDLGVSVDASVAATRFSREVADLMVTHRGEQTKFQVAYNKAINTLRDMIMNRSLQMRQNETLVRQVLTDKSISNNGSLFVQKWSGHMSRLDYVFNEMAKDARHAFAKAFVAQKRREAMNRLVAEMMEEVDSWGDRKHDRVLMVWKSILTESNKTPYGSYDRLIFQPAARGNKNLMDVLIEALVIRGWATPPATNVENEEADNS